MKRLSFFCLIVILFTMNSCSRKYKYTDYDSDATYSMISSGISFTEAPLLGDILDIAEADNKLVFIDFYTTWCMPCRLMDEEVFSDRDIGDFINENFISYKVNAEEGNGINLRTLYEVQVYPTLVFVDSKGRVVLGEEGALSHSKFRNLARKAMAMAKKMPPAAEGERFGEGGEGF